MNKISKQELELRKWALEMSLEYGQYFFPQHRIKNANEIVSNAKRIVELITINWIKPIENCFDLDTCLIPERNP